MPNQPINRKRRAARQSMFYALADPNRRTIMELLASKGQMSATEIYGNFTVSHPAVSQHLRVLREAELVRLQKDAQRHIYSLNPGGINELGDWVKELTELWSRRFDQLDEVLLAEKKKRAKGGGK